MPVQIAQVHDVQSAEFLKSEALAETDHAAALPRWRAARALDPDSPTLVAHLALALHRTGRGTEMVELLRGAITRWPRMAHLANLLAVVLTDQGHFRAAERLFRHVLALDPDYGSARDSLKRVAEVRGRSRPASGPVRAAIDAAVAAAGRRPAPTLAVCMIVKDEAEFIVGAVESVAGLADEVIVVDTGSTDETVALARGAGARVEFFPWIGDFSAARNASLEHATADWIMVLDADERLVTSARSTVRAVMEEFRDDADPRVVCVRINNLTREGRFIGDGFSGRIFPNRPDMRFEGRVHEEVARNRTDVATDYRLDIAFDHFGADPEVMREKAKDARNIDLLEAKLVEDPDHLMTWFYLASQHWIAGRRDDAVDAFEQVVELFERDPSRYGLGVRQVPVPYSYVGLVRGHLDAGRIDDAVSCAHRGFERFPDNPDLAYHGGLALSAAGEVESARAHLLRAASTTIGGYALIGMHDRQIGDWKAAKAVADIDFESGEQRSALDGYAAVWSALPEDAALRIAVAARMVEMASGLDALDLLPTWTRRYLALRPDERSVAVQVAGQLTSAGDLQGAYDLLTGLVADDASHGRDLELVCAVGSVAEQAGDDAEALRWYEKAVELGCRDPRFWLNLARLMARNGNAEAAQEAMNVAKQLIGPGG